MSFDEGGWPAGSRRVAIANPGFQTSYPRIYADNFIPDAIRAIMEPSWTRDTVPAREAEIVRMPDVYLAGEGLVFDRDLKVVAGSITQQPPHHIAAARAELAVALEAGTLVRREGPAVLCVKPGQRNYGHWLVEMLPKADVARRAFPGEDLSFLVPDIEGGMRRVVADSMALLGVPGDRVVPALGRPEHVSDLILVSGLTEHGAYMSPLVFRTLDTIAARVEPLPHHELIYVRRRVPAHRRLADDDAIASYLAAEGYIVMSPEDYPLAHQIAAFRGARQVIGPASAALTNVAFCRPGTELAVFYPGHMPDTFYWFIAQHRRLDYLDIRCATVGPPGTHLDHDRDLAVDAAIWPHLVASGRRRAGRDRGSLWRRALRRAIRT